jgi:hypothetical protein
MWNCKLVCCSYISMIITQPRLYCSLQLTLHHSTTVQKFTVNQISTYCHSRPRTANPHWLFIYCCRLSANLLRILCSDSNIREQVKVFEGIPICLRYIFTFFKKGCQSDLVHWSRKVLNALQSWNHLWPMTYVLSYWFWPFLDRLCRRL